MKKYRYVSVQWTRQVSNSGICLQDTARGTRRICPGSTHRLQHDPPVPRSHRTTLCNQKQCTDIPIRPQDRIRRYQAKGVQVIKVQELKKIERYHKSGL